MDTTIVAALIGAVATIVAALIVVPRSRDKQSAQPIHEVASRPVVKARTPSPSSSPPAPADPAPARFTVRGEVIRAVGQDLGIRVENADEMRQFWQDHRIDTKLDWAGAGPPVASIGRKGDIERCKPGDRASMTLVVEERANGKRGVRTVDFEVHSADASR